MVLPKDRDDKQSGGRPRKQAAWRAIVSHSQEAPCGLSWYKGLGTSSTSVAPADHHEKLENLCEGSQQVDQFTLRLVLGHENVWDMRYAQRRIQVTGDRSPTIYHKDRTSPVTCFPNLPITTIFWK